MSDAFNQSWTLLKTRRGRGYEWAQEELRNFLQEVRANDPIAMSHMAVNFERQMKYALDNDNYEGYEEIRDNAEREVGRELANQAADNALTQHLAEQKEEQRGLPTFDDEELQGMVEELDEADIKSQQKEQPDEMIERQNREVEAVGGVPWSHTAEMAHAYEEEFGHTGARSFHYANMRAVPFELQTEMMIHHMLTPFAPALTLEEFQIDMANQIGPSAMARVVARAKSEVEDMSDVEREQRRRYAEAGGSPGSAGEMLAQFEEAMLEHMLQMADPSQSDGSQTSNDLAELTMTVEDLFGRDAAEMMRERALEAHAEQTRLFPGHPAHAVPPGHEVGRRLPHEWRSHEEHLESGKDVSQLGLQEFDKNIQLTPQQRDDVRFLANLGNADYWRRKRRAPQQRTMANRRIEQRGEDSGNFALVADDESGKSHEIARTNASLYPGKGGRPVVMSLNSETRKPFRRQKAYRDLLLGLLNAGFDIQSDNRNTKYSNPFHANLLQTLPPGIEAELNGQPVPLEELLRRQAIIEQGGPLADRYRRGGGVASLPINTGDAIRYKKNIKEIPNWGDLRPDTGAIPIVTVDKPLTPVEPTMDDKPRIGRAAENFYDKHRQSTFNLPSNPTHQNVRPTANQRAMGITYEVPNTQGSLLRPRSQLEDIAGGYHPFAVSRKNVPFPAVSEQPAFGDVAAHMRAGDFAEVYGLPYPTHDEIIAAHENLPMGHFPPLLTEDQKAAIRELSPNQPPLKPEPVKTDEFDRLAQLFG